MKRSFLTHHRNTALLTTLALAACAGSNDPGVEEESTPEIPGFEAFFGKADTGYVGNRAAEIEATLAGKVKVNVDKTNDELTEIASKLKADPRSWEHRDITSQVTEQLKYARNSLKAQKLNLNLEGGSPTFTEIEVVEGGLVLHYEVEIESLIKMKDLEEDGLEASDLVGREIAAQVPFLPEGLFDRLDKDCTRDPDTGGSVDPADLGAHNLFYYFAPDADGCELSPDELTTASYVVHSSLDAPTVYPEYDLLTADGKVSMVAIFGQIEHGELKPNDWGFLSFNDMTREFRSRGFRTRETFSDDRGHKLEKTYPGGLVVTIDMYTPHNIADEVPRDEADAMFRELIKTHEVVYYNGHAFYGSLNVLDDPAVYPEGVYQVINMDACWSYAYYTKQIFRNRATDADPDGYAFTDVINNTEPGITGSERTAVVLYDALFKGAAAQFSGGDASIFSWNNIVEYMNEHAEARARLRTTHPNPEIYGVSGVSTNRWSPNGPIPPVEPDGQVFETTDPVSIPDNDPAGATSILELPNGLGNPATVTVTVDIEHPYIGDLTVTVEHAGVTVTLHSLSGGGSDNLRLSLPTHSFAGTDAAGVWTLKVVDSAAQDVGTIKTFAVALPAE